MGLTKQQLEALNDSSFPNNNAGAITPAILRDYNTEAIINTVNQDSYTNDSASFDSRIDSLIINTGSFVSTASFNAYTQSNDSKVNALIAATGSYVTSAITASSLITASVSQSTITFTKGDGSQFNIVVADISGSTFDTGSLVTTASFNAYTASQDFINTTFATTSSVNTLSASIFQTDATQSVNISSNSSSIGLLQTFSGSEYKNDSASFDSRINSAGGQPQVQDEGSILGNATSFNFIGAGVTTALSAGTASVTIPGGGGSIDTGSFATTGSNTFTGDQTILGSIVSNPTTSLTELFSQAFVSGAVQYNITASNAVSQSNLVFGGNPSLSTLTGSVVISGSNNILFNPSKNLTGANAFTKGYVGGNNNYFTTIPQLHTQSLFNPTMSNNIGTGLLTMNLITSSLGVPFFVNNNFSSTITLNHQSGTIAMQNNTIIGTLTSNQNSLTSGTAVPTLTGNTIGAGVNVILNHTSSSIQTTNNGIFGGLTVNNNYYHTSSNNAVAISNNIIGGQTQVININGSPSTNIVRTAVGNFIGGLQNTIQLDGVGTDLASLRNVMVYGNNLIVSGASSAAATNTQGSTFVGRYNDINAGLADSGKTIFAVGTGTSTSNRKTALSVDSSSVVNISGSLTITGSNLNIDGSGNVTASTFLATSNGQTAFIYNQQSSGSVSGVWNTNYGKDGLQVYQYQGQPYAFNVILTANQINAYTGSEFQWGLQTNGTLSLPGGGSTYFAMSSGSTITGSGPAANKVGLDYLETAMILDMKADTAFNRRVYVDKGMYVSQSIGGGVPALIVNGSGAGNNVAIAATGSVRITGSLSVSDTASFNAPVVINNNSDLYLYGHKQFNIGAFYSTVTQSGSAGVSQSIQFNTTDISQGVSIVSGSQFTLANNGTYNIQFSAQVLSTTGADNVWFWLKKNGTNIADTAGRVTLANNAELMAAWNYVVSANANDYIELVWQNLSGNGQLLYNAPTGNIPAVTSVIATVTQVR